LSIIGFIVLGDRTSHGGVVISGDPTWTIDGQPVARVGDKVSCPRCKRTSTIVSSRFLTVIDLGKPAAFDQDVTDCGALLYSRHNGHAGWGDDSVEASDNENSEAARDQAAAVAPAEDYAPKKAPRFQEHFILKNSETGELLTGIPYTIRTGDGNVVEGETDSDGRTGVVWTDSPLPVEVQAHPKSAEGEDPYHYAEPGGEI
jgi:uncharacterized Zn-binding protein involved in type VI secretion